MNRAFVTILVLLLAVWIFAPGDYYLNFVSRALIAGTLALSLNLLMGEAGLMSLGHNAFTGIAAYGIAWSVALHGMGHLTAIVLALAGATAVAAFYGLLALRVQGIGFLMITLALGQITWGLSQRMVEVTGGENGITGLRRPMPFGVSLDNAANFYCLTAIVFLGVYCVLKRFTRSNFGVTVRGTRDQPRRMAALGYDVWLIRWLTFTFAGFIAGVAGVLDVYYNKFASTSALSLTEAATALLMVVVGGSRAFLGPVCGAFIVLLCSQIASSYVERWLGLLGVLFLLIVVFMPDGIVPGFQRMLTDVRARLARSEPMPRPGDPSLP
jgi:branched-chain amino acid transport system permease protein